jgi:hypothetical protein
VHLLTAAPAARPVLLFGNIASPIVSACLYPFCSPDDLKYYAGEPGAQYIHHSDAQLSF